MTQDENENKPDVPAEPITPEPLRVWTIGELDHYPN